MKITIISTAYPLRGGIAQYTGILYAKLRQHHDVDVITFKRQYPAFLFPGKTQIETSTDESVKIESDVMLDSIGPLSWYRAYRKIKRTKPDLIIFKYWMPFFAPCFGVICWLVHRFTETRILYICDNVIPHEKRPGDIALTRFAFRHADYFIAQSAVVREDLLKLKPKARYKEIPHPVYDIFGSLRPKREAKEALGYRHSKVILFFGYVRAYKGLDLLLRALPRIREQVDVGLAVVGEFYEKETIYTDLIDELKIGDSVYLNADFVPNERVSLFFSAADVVVLPYKSATQSGIVQMAYHLDKPCIVTDVGGLSEVVLNNRTGYVVSPGDISALADAVIRFYKEDREAEFSFNVKQEKKKYSWENMTAAIESFVSEDAR